VTRLKPSDPSMPCTRSADPHALTLPRDEYGLDVPVMSGIFDGSAHLQDNIMLDLSQLQSAY
jgi:hypothetical protein